MRSLERALNRILRQLEIMPIDDIISLCVYYDIKGIPGSFTKHPLALLLSKLLEHNVYIEPSYVVTVSIDEKTMFSTLLKDNVKEFVRLVNEKAIGKEIIDE